MVKARTGMTKLVKNWALKFGVDLWEFGHQFTKMNQIQNKYQKTHLDVIRKDGLILVRELAAEVKNHMDFKINAVMVSNTFLFLQLLGITWSQMTLPLQYQ
ncbi:unnamed protein product [Euphydryas editha]|uniref:Uncharacterized protein n=2 Tax=Euphydryas editha TaxID=104508 RepID=A0AAU9UWB0_EUPED|nr:unnamed protein product [Euphydryas editha]